MNAAAPSTTSAAFLRLREIYVNYVFNALEKTCNVCLTHPKYVKAIKVKKTDKRDAKRIAELFKCDLVRSSFIPPADIRQLRDLCRYYVKLTYTNTAEKNRARNCLTMGNFKLDDVFSDVFGKSSSRIIEKLLEQGNSDFDVAPLLDKRCKASAEKVTAALDGELDANQAEKLKLILKHQEFLSELQSSLEAAILRLAEKYQPQIQLLMSVPGINTPFTAIRIPQAFFAKNAKNVRATPCGNRRRYVRSQFSLRENALRAPVSSGFYLKPLSKCVRGQALRRKTTIAAARKRLLVSVAPVRI